MDPKELRANAPLSSSVSDESNKYVHSSSMLPANKNKTYHEIGSSSMCKVDAAAIRPCAIIGPDRVHTQTPADVYLKKLSVEPWSTPENTYQQPPSYPHKLPEYQPIRNISPRQTFQENMPRIMVPPTYSSIKNSDEANLKHSKLNMPQEAKYCDVPYNMTSVTNEHKSVRNSDIPISSVNSSFTRNIPHYGWPAGVNVRPQRPYGAPEFYQYAEYPSYVGPRPVTMSRPPRIHREDAAQVYSERLYQEANIRFKPYPLTKEKHQTRYDYVNTYPNTFHPPVSFPPHKYDLQKSVPNHPYPIYPQVPLKYLDRRVHETFLDGYQRSNQQPNFNPQYHNQVIHPAYGPVPGNYVQSKSFPDLPTKQMTINNGKLPYDPNNKIYIDLDPSQNKAYPIPENVFYNDINHTQHMRSDILLPNHTTLNMHSTPQHQIYRKEHMTSKHFEFNHSRNLDQLQNLNYSLPRLALQYSPNAIAISPSDSNTSNDTTHTLGNSQEDCGYVSQSSTTSVRSIDAGNIPVSKDMYRRQDYNIHMYRNSLHLNRPEQITKNKINCSSKKNINVRQFLQMWNEGEDETTEPNKEVITQSQPNNFNIPTDTINNQEQLYVLGLVNVPNEELSKYEHIQKISKLPENIKGYNSLELLNQYEELLESPNINKYHITSKLHKDHQPLLKIPNNRDITLPRPVSPLDVEAKISQSVIHKEVGCNFEIKPCSPQMLNVEVATPIQNVLGERIIEKVSNPITSKSPMLNKDDDSKNCNSGNSDDKLGSCDMINKQYPTSNFTNITQNNNYSVQDFATNSGVCFPSLPQLDNDIELNFPEINQQFIKANKIESNVQISHKDLPQLSVDQVKQNSNILPSNILSPKNIVPERESSKLSKYRKTKKYDSVSKDGLEINNTAQQRIDSVIIKNPDTIKSKEDNDVSLSAKNKDSNPIENYYNNSYDFEQNSKKNLSTITHENNEERGMLSFEEAIDFSLNKAEEASSYDCLSNCTKDSNLFTNKTSHSDDETDKEIISKTQQQIELNIKHIKEYENNENNVKINNEQERLTKPELNVHNLISDAATLPVKDSVENNSPVIQNSTNDTQIEYPMKKKENITYISNEELIIQQNIVHNTCKVEILNPEEKNNITNIDSVVIIEKTEANCKSETLPGCQKQEKCDRKCENVSCRNYDNDQSNNAYEESQREFYDVDVEKRKETYDITIKDNIFTLNNKVDIILNEETFNKNDEENADSIDNNEILEYKLRTEKNTHNYKVKNNEDESVLDLLINSDKIETKTLNGELKELMDLGNSKTSLTNQNEGKIGTSDKEFQCDTTDEFHTEENANESEISEMGDTMYSSNKIDLNNIVKNELDIPEKDFISGASISNSKGNSINLEDNENIISSNINKEIIQHFKKEESVESNSESYNPSSKLEFYNKKISYSKVNKVFPKKELYSPWVQKLFMFNEGICSKILSMENEITKEKVIMQNKLEISAISDNKKIKDLKEEANIMSNVKDNLLTFLDNNSDEVQKIHYDSVIPQEDECIESLLTKSLHLISEDKIKNIDENKPKSVNLIDSPLVTRRAALKRSLSESALEDYKENENAKDFVTNKRRKGNQRLQPLISEDLCNIIQSNRRNSISTFCNEDNVYILIDNDLIISEVNDDSEKIFYTEMADVLENNSSIDNTASATTNASNSDEVNRICDYSSSLENCEEKLIEGSWVEDVACIETVVCEDTNEEIDDDAMSANKSTLIDENNSDESVLYYDNKHIDKIKDIYGSNMCSYDTQILQTLHMTPQMDVDKTLADIESHNSIDYKEYNEILNNSYENNDYLDKLENDIISYNKSEIINEKENLNASYVKIDPSEEELTNNFDTSSSDSEEMRKCIVHSCEPNDDYIKQSPKKTNSNISNSSSPEVSSTTSEEKNSSILLKITNYNGSRVSQINEIGADVMERISYKLTEKNDYQSYNSNFSSSRTLITKAAQKYIPPIKETIRDLKIKLSLPQHRLHTLKQLKISKVEPKIDNNIVKYANRNPKHEKPKKQKPKFEDVLKSIDEIQFKKHKNRIKKGKSVIPKVVIKKHENGAHYASSKTTITNNESYNPDLTGRKWQPWVFLEKNNFIDKMAIKKKVKAIYCHRKNNYVLAEKFRKYKSIYNADFIITQPSTESLSKGNLKYTIRLKHK